MKNIITQLAKYVRSQPDFQESQSAYVSIYRHSRCYGGPEEGGWWYSRYELEGSKAFSSMEEAKAWLEKAKIEVERLNLKSAPQRHLAMARLPDNDSEALPDSGEGYIPVGWDDGGKLLVTVEERKGSLDNMNEETPHYE